MKLNQKIEITLGIETIGFLNMHAYRKGLSLEAYMEYVLMEKANDFELSDDYKAKMDDYFNRKEKGETTYVSEEEFKRRTRR